MKTLLIGLLIVVVALAVLFTGIYAIKYDVVTKQDIKIIGFSEQTDMFTGGKISTCYTESHFQDYSSHYKAFNSYIYYGSLSDSERLVYQIFEFALDNRYPNILFDEALLEDLNYSVEEILYFLSLDSALVEQNLIKRAETYPISYTERGIHRESTARLFYVENFSSDRLAKKEEAIKQGEQIVQLMPNSLTANQKAEWIFDYLGTNVTWVSGDDTNKDFLYDTLCLGKSNCDGFANAFSLLSHMVEIKSFEKVYFTDTEESGHTWNAIYLDGAWYNVDATEAHFSATQEIPWRKTVRIHFGFSDTYQRYLPSFSSIIPPCENDFFPVSISIQTLTADNVKSLINEAYKQTSNKYIVADVEHYRFEDLQTLINSLDPSISASAHYVSEECTLVFFYCDGNIQ